jgi:hypothetical protein
MILIIKKFLFNCSFIGESLSCCNHSCNSSFVRFLLVVCLLDTWKHWISNYWLTVIAGLTAFGSILDRLSNFRLLMHHITGHQVSLGGIVWKASAVNTYSIALIISTNKLWRSNWIINCTVLGFLWVFQNCLLNRLATYSCRSTIGLLLLLPSTFLQVVHVVFVD